VCVPQSSDDVQEELDDEDEEGEDMLIVCVCVEYWLNADRKETRLTNAKM
jgi:hypothetical protein